VDSEDRDRVLRGVPGEEDDEVGVKLPVDAVLVDQPLPRPVVGEFVLLEGVRIVGASSRERRASWMVLPPGSASELTRAIFISFPFTLSVIPSR